jgi:hypothetical protein
LSIQHTSSDADWLLPGEDLQSDALNDAEHWVMVYEELLSFLSQANLEIPAVDRCRRRLAYWSRRVAELTRRIGL